jgi:hypothetical protein
MAFAEELNFAETNFLAGRSDVGYAILRGCLSGVFNGQMPGGLSCHAFVDGTQRMNWEFADGIIGTISEPLAAMVDLSGPGEWQEHRRTHKSRRGWIVSYYVAFDEPADDGSGDGPYRGAEIEASCLEPISD